MDKDLIDSGAFFGRTILCEILAILKYSHTFNPIIPSNEFQEDFEKLKLRVGASRFEDFKELAIALSNKTLDRTYSDYLTYAFDECIKSISEASEQEYYFESFSKSMLFNAEDHPIEEKEIDFSIKTIENNMALVAILTNFYETYEKKSVLEETTGVPREKLERKIKTLNLQMSTLRRLLLCFGQDMTIRVLDENGNELNPESRRRRG